MSSTTPKMTKKEESTATMTATTTTTTINTTKTDQASTTIISSSSTTTTTTNSGGSEDKVKMSKYYFFSSTPQEEAKRYAPQKQDNATAATAAANAAKANTAAKGPSSWNTAGTWEEKDMSSWAQKRLKELFNSMGGSINQGSVKITEVTKCDGEASIIFVRGKKRVGFEMNVKAKFKYTNGDDVVEGHIEIPNLDSEESENFEINVSCESGKNQETASGVLRQNAPSLVRKQVNQFIKELHEF